MAKIISAVNFKSGGKSSVLRILAEQLNAPILNFDKNRDAKYYNKIYTININEKCRVFKTLKGISICNEELEGFNHYLCDFGGYHDSRISTIDTDLYIIPTFEDFETIRESIRFETYLRKLYKRGEIKKLKILYILNGAMIKNDKEMKNKSMKFLKETLQKINSDADILYMPYSKLIKDLVNNKTTVKEKMSSFVMSKWAYKNILAFSDELKNYIEENI